MIAFFRLAADPMKEHDIILNCRPLEGAFHYVGFFETGDSTQRTGTDNGRFNTRFSDFLAACNCGTWVSGPDPRP
jgi:hypothetical protein